MPNPPPFKPYRGPPVQMSKQQKISKPKVSVVVPIRNRWGCRVVNCLRSVQLQTLGGVEVVFADFGSHANGHRGLMDLLKPYDCTVYYCPTKEVWSLSRARNMGIRRARAPIVVSLDVDMILERNTLHVINMVQKHKPQTLIVSRVRNLPDINLCKVRLPRDYPRLAKLAEPHRPGVGGLMSATRSWWHRVRGFDERMKAWGADDNDLVKRARADGLDVINLERQGFKNVDLYHQHHVKAIPFHKGILGEKRYNAYYELNVSIFRGDDSIRRNDRTWGCVP